MTSACRIMANCWILGLLFLAAADLSAQSVARVVFLQEAPGDDVSQTVDELRRKTIGLQKQLDESDLDFSEFGDEGFETTGDSDNSQKVIEIRKNLELLQQVIKDKRAKMMTEAAEKSVQDSLLQSRLELEAPQEETAASSEPDDTPEVGVRMPKKVLDKIVNAFELGNSLFLAGNIEQAIKYYEFVPVDRLSASERNWLEFMLASCHQRNENFELAEAGFRSVAGFKDSPRLAQSAKESLKYVVSRKRLSDVVDEYNSRADDVLQKASELMGDSEDGK